MRDTGENREKNDSSAAQALSVCVGIQLELGEIAQMNKKRNPSNKYQ